MTMTMTQPRGQPAAIPSALPYSPLVRPGELHNPALYTTVLGVPILDAHSDDPERGVVDEPLLQLIAKNSNFAAARGDYPGIILGHTRNKTTIVVAQGNRTVTRPGVEEVNQPRVVGYATNFMVADFRGRPCLYCDFHYRAADADLAASFPYRSVERLEPPKVTHNPTAHAIDRIALLRTPSQRDLGVIRYGRGEAPNRRTLYCQFSSPMTSTSRKATHMTESQVHDLIADYFSAHYANEIQRRELEAMRDGEDIDLDQDEMDSISSMPPEDFKRKKYEIRQYYSRKESARPRGYAARDAFAPGTERARAIALATRENLTYSEALSRVSQGH